MTPDELAFTVIMVLVGYGVGTVLGTWIGWMVIKRIEKW